VERNGALTGRQGAFEVAEPPLAVRQSRQVPGLEIGIGQRLDVGRDVLEQRLILPRVGPDDEHEQRRLPHRQRHPTPAILRRRGERGEHAPRRVEEGAHGIDGVGRGRLAHRLRQHVDRALWVVAARVVVGQELPGLVQRPRVLRLDRARRCAVQRATLVRRDQPVGDLLRHGVAKGQ
jgi:hypothetical protein